MNVCPSDQSIEINFGQSAAVLPWTKPEATDNSIQNPTVTCSKESGSQFETGTTVVTCIAFDSAGNQANCSFTVQIKGVEIDGRPQIFKHININTCKLNYNHNFPFNSTINN